MANLFTKVKKYLEANSKTWDAEESNIILQNDGSGDFIKTWNVTGLAEPTTEQIASYDTAADLEERQNAVREIRKRPTVQLKTKWICNIKIILMARLHGKTMWRL